MTHLPNPKARKLIISVGSLFVAAFSAIAWHAVGNGGDPLRLLFKNAKEHAATMVAKMHVDAFNASTSNDVKQWILEHQSELEQKITIAEHRWTDSTEAHCALAIPSENAIELSYPTCRLSASNREQISFLLVHEAVHLLGVADEEFADGVAIAVVNAWKSGVLDWQPIAETAELQARSHHSAVWTGEKMIVFGGVLADGNITNSGAMFDPVTNTWTQINNDGAPSRAYHRALWTGSKMVVFGGIDPNSQQYGVWESSGAIYDPDLNQWEAIASPREANVRVGVRTSQTLVFTGDKLVIWGSATGSAGVFTPESGAVYDLAARTWQTIPAQQHSPNRWSGHSAVYHDGKMIVWGGKLLPGSGSPAGETNTGAILDLSSLTWTPMSQADVPAPRVDHQAIVAGDQMIVFGGSELARNVRGSGGVYNITSGQWSPFQSEVALQRIDHTLVWSGAEAIIWGGKTSVSSNSLNSIAALEPGSQSFRAVSAKTAPAARSGHSAVWTGMSMIVWGGVSESGAKLGDGGLFYP